VITRAGVAVAVVVLVFGVGGVLFGYPELLLVGAAAACALLIAGTWLLLSPNVTITREVRPQGVSQGQDAFSVITVTNTSSRRCPPIVVRERIGASSVPVAVASLPAGGRAERGIRLPTQRRGLFQIGPSSFGHSDPLRLVNVWHHRGEKEVLRIRPLIHAVPPLPTGGSPDLDGPTTDAAPHGGIAFHSLREYVRGDDLRLVHWPSTAKAGHLMVRNNVVPNEPSMMVVLDTSTAPYSDDFFEDAVRVAASLAVSGRTHGFPVEIATTGGRRVPAGRGVATADPALDLLAEIAPTDDDRGLLALPSLTPHQAGTVLGVVTGQAAPEALAAISAVRRHYSVITVVQVGELFRRPAPRVEGALVVNVRTSAEFAASWPPGRSR
jgi:uncharacterized protein (DUF58 family)